MRLYFIKINIIFAFFVLKVFVNDYFFDALIFGMGAFAAYEAAKILSKAGVMKKFHEEKGNK